MNKSKMILVAIAAAAAMAACTTQTVPEEVAAKDAFDGKFLFGAAVNDRVVSGEDSLGQEIVKKHFNTIVAENCMKSEVITPEKGVYDWTLADRFVDFGNANDMFVVGHCLVWHSQLAKWFPYDDEGNYVSSDTLRERMRTYITDVVTRYKGRVHGWDVVNEAILDDGTYRESPFYQILGEEYIPYAFELAHQADPDAELYINDYNMSRPAKRDKYVEIVNDLKSRGLRIDAVGMQTHVGMDYPDFGAWDASLEAFGNTGCNVMVTEWDMTALPTITQSANVSDYMEYDPAFNPYPHGLPADVDSVWNVRMDSVIDLCLKHSDIVSRVNAWGVSDGDSWKNDWPMPGRTEYPLLFDRNYQMKPFLKSRLQSLTTEN